jgi:hypothetical protein
VPITVPRVRLIHWSAAEAEERADQLHTAGYEVSYGPLDPSALRELREVPPAAVVIDLGRLPSHGRDAALAVRKAKTTRHVPLLFVGGEPDKVARLKEVLPDAVYTSWSQIRSSLTEAIANPPADPVVPTSLFDVYSGTPLPKKLGIRAHSAVDLVDAPEGFEGTLGTLPEGVVVRRGTGNRCGVTLWFPKSREDLNRRIEAVGVCADQGALWIIWPKKSAGVATDLSQDVVRQVGLAAGLVDYKVSAIDSIWSGLCFRRRKSTQM